MIWVDRWRGGKEDSHSVLNTDTDHVMTADPTRPLSLTLFSLPHYPTQGSQEIHKVSL